MNAKTTIEKMKREASAILFNLTTMDYLEMDANKLEKMATSIDNLYHNYEKLLWLWKKGDIK